MMIGSLVKSEEFDLINNGQLTIDDYLNDKIINYPLSIINLKKRFTLAEGATHAAICNDRRKIAFTLAEGATHVAICSNRRKVAFTLAEVLITLGVIGVVAAITMPMLIANINERVNSERQANIVYKVTQAMEHMRALGKLTAYDSTESFVNELQKHLKIQKICDKDHISDCWPTEKVTTTTGEGIYVNEVKTSKYIGFKNREIETNNVGLILADGASLILNYDAGNAKAYDIGDKVQASSIGLPVGNNKSRVFEYTTSVTGPVAFVMDVNGKRGPNSETIDGKYNDIRSFNGAKMDDGCVGDKYNGKCIYYVGTSYDPIDCSSSSAPNYSYCYPTPSGYSTDYWAGAKYKCDSLGMNLPSVEQLENIKQNKSKYLSIALNDGWFYSSEETSGAALHRANGVSLGNDELTYRYKTNIYNVLCIKTTD